LAQNHGGRPNPGKKRKITDCTMPNATFNKNIYEMFVNNVQPESTKRSHPFLGYEIKSNYEGKRYEEWYTGEITSVTLGVYPYCKKLCKQSRMCELEKTLLQYHR
jgi:hypothetical protein